MASIVVFINLPPAARQALADRGHAVRHIGDFPSRDTLIDAAADARIALTNGELGISGEEIARLPQLGLICAIGVGYESVDLDAARARGITVTNGRGTNDSAVADHAFALLLALASGVVPANATVQAGQWRSFAPGGSVGGFVERRRGIEGKRLGLLGLGRIGTMIARRGELGFGMDVAYHARREVPDTTYRYFGTVGELAAWSDFLVVATPGGGATRHLVDAEALRALGPEGFVVNIGRGSVVDSQALAAAIRDGEIAGAALDVVEGEPDIPAELLGHDNLILTPHVAGRGPEPLRHMVRLLGENIDAWLAGRPVLTPVEG